MPNWCEGSLKIRGKFEDLKKLCKEEFAVYSIKITRERVFTELDKNATKIMCGDKEGAEEFWMQFDREAHINGTRRNFVTSSDIVFFNNGDKSVCVVEFKAAWGIDSAPYLELAKKYNVDIRLYGFERGMEFNQEVIIENGEIIKDEEIKFDDYDWECVMPHLGG